MKERELAELDGALSAPDVWEDADRAKELQQRRARVEASIKKASRLAELEEEARTFLELAREGEDALPDVGASIDRLGGEVEQAELDTLLHGEHDQGNAILEVHPGAGGTESQDWAEMLLRMYTRWAERHGYDIETIDYQSGDEAGIKSATIAIRGENVYGYLNVERGVHRLVRISPYDAQARRHTSFASIDVAPEIEGDIEIDLDEKDLRVDTFRASGAGGQHVNKTESAIRITHHPTGIVVSCQNERSQHRNRDVAMQVLKSKLYALALREAEEKMAKEVGEKKSIEWGSQIRSYVLAPYRLVKDHRTAFEVGDADRVLDGDIDGFIRSALFQARGESDA